MPILLVRLPHSILRWFSLIHGVLCKMPRINDQFLECVFYLYPSRKTAEAGEQMGGTGFVTGVKSAVDSGTLYGYAITNQHVAVDGGSSCIRVNRRDGSVEILEFDPANWLTHPAGDDLAIIPLGGMKAEIHAIRLFDESMFVTEELALKENLGPGDEVFMVGRFIHHDGKERNDPSVRFGNISMQPRPIIQDRGHNRFPQLSYAVELRSMGGYSGSPVFVYRMPWNMITGSLTVGSPKIWFLGVNWGHITDKWEVREGWTRSVRQNHESSVRKVNYVRANTGMNGVIPAWKVKDLLDLPALAEHRRKQEEALATRLGG